ncbi:odorant receptor 35a isoform X1 [Drosophila yakuba]|uniref:odorant receptor 35a isoform X1 n=1 Tax=Drosophila yakuba TaxID=7245 RepID=UPI0019307C16|nr:odorant receptor 35a isoform X1 [Drosophila yakuba]
MVRYVPRFADGQKVKLAWPLAIFRLNHIFWPLDPSTGQWARYLDKNPMANYIYAIWFGAKTVELLSLGQIGSDLAFTTDSLSSMYYLTHWEQILQYSTNPSENLRLLKLINLSIEMNSKPFYVTGLKYFRVSLQAVLKVSEKRVQSQVHQLSAVLQILQASFSYFTFLTSMQRRQMSN